MKEKITTEKAPIKKKQKAGLNAVRPNDDIEIKFKQEAKENKLSQTELFEKIFLEYINKNNEDAQDQVLDVSPELNLISKSLANVMDHFKSIATKAQDTIMTEKKSKEQQQKISDTEIATLKARVTELEIRNKELESANATFEDVKQELLKEQKSKANIKADREALEVKYNTVNSEYESIKKSYNNIEIILKKQSEIDKKTLKNEIKELQKKLKQVEVDHEKKLELIKKELELQSKEQVLEFRNENIALKEEVAKLSKPKTTRNSTKNPTKDKE